MRHEPPNAGTKLYELDRGVGEIGLSRGADAEMEMGDRDWTKMRPTTTDTFAVDENVDEPWAVVAPSIPPVPISGPGLVPDTTVGLNLDSDYSAHHDVYDYDISNNVNEDNGAREVSRGRKGRSRKTMNARLGTNLTLPPSILALPFYSPHRTPPTRESSPSRFVRFVDHADGESGNTGNGSGNGGRKVLVVAIPPPVSYYGDGKSLVQ